MFNKRLVAAVAILTLIAASLQQQQTTSGSCSRSEGKASKFYAYLASNFVGLYNYSTIFSPSWVCRGEFDIFGTCCTTDGMVELVKRDNEEMALRWKRYLRALGKVNLRMLAGLKRLVPKMSSVDILNKHALIARSAVAATEFKEAYWMVPHDSRQMQSLKTFIQSFEAQLITFQQHGKQCFDSLRTARANYHCAGCSARASSFLQSSSEEEIVLKVTQSACAALVNSCFRVWRFNWYLKMALHYVAILRNINKKDNADDPITSDARLPLAYITGLKESFEACSFNETLQQVDCPETAANNHATPVHVSRLCRYGFTANKNNGFVEGDESFGEFQEKDAELALNDAEGDKYPDPVLKRRRLQLKSEPTLMIEVSTNTPFETLMSTNLGLMPTTAVDTLQAGLKFLPSTSSCQLSTVLLAGLLHLLAITL